MGWGVGCGGDTCAMCWRSLLWLVFRHAVGTMLDCMTGLHDRMLAAALQYSACLQCASADTSSTAELGYPRQQLLLALNLP